MAVAVQALFTFCVTFVCLFLQSSAEGNSFKIEKKTKELFWTPERVSNGLSHGDSNTNHYYGNTLSLRKKVATSNLASYLKLVKGDRATGTASVPPNISSGELSQNSQAGLLQPGNGAPGFVLPTLEGPLSYPGPVLQTHTPVLLHSFTSHSAFLQCLWNCSGSIEALINHSPPDTHYVFMSQSQDAYSDSLWMRNRFHQAIENVQEKSYRSSNTVLHRKLSSLQKRVHFVTVPVYEVGSWVAAIFKQWACSDHNCGLDQAVFSVAGKRPLIVPRLDARYDWLPKFPSGKTFNVTEAGDGCTNSTKVKGHVALVSDSGCSYFTKVKMMESSGAAGVVVVQKVSPCPQDMNCGNPMECAVPLSIPATMVSSSEDLLSSVPSTVTFQNTPSDNFFFGIDRQGQLAEAGWFLYPSFNFLAWQAQWFEFAESIKTRLQEKALVVPVLNNTIMQGAGGAVATATLPPMAEMAAFDTFELDMALSCPGSRDGTCPAWDHTVQLYVCCNHTSEVCGSELGRWISPFRRRIGRWLTDVTPLLPLLDGPRCTFTMKTVPWAMAWKPSLNLRFSGQRSAQTPIPMSITPLYQPGATFDNKYNTHFVPYDFKLPQSVTKVEIVSVITGHGSDENGCGEFCVTSHHYVVNNGRPHNKTFDNAGTPLGCALRVPQGVEPDEHGTWLYGRDGWCDGQQVSPWVVDITSEVYRTKINNIRYFGWFQGSDPNPKQNPGNMIVYSYIVFYR